MGYALLTTFVRRGSAANNTRTSIKEQHLASTTVDSNLLMDRIKTLFPHAVDDEGGAALTPDEGKTLIDALHDDASVASAFDAKEAHRLLDDNHSLLITYI